MRPPVRLVAAAACGVLLAGCGAAVDPPAQTREALRTRVGVLVDAANAGDASSARTALAALRADVASALRLGSLSEERAAELSRLAGEVEAALPVRPRASAPPTTAPVRPTPQAPRQGSADPDQGKGKGDQDGGKGDQDKGDQDKGDD